MTTGPKLTIMVSLYNSGEWIRNRLDNLIQITELANSEIWCVNANSPDQRDHDIPQEYQVKYVRLPERIGVYAAWNYIIQNSSSQYITNANTDDLTAPDCYTRLMSILDNNNEYDFAYPSWYTTSVPNQKWHQLIETDDSGRPGHYNGNIDKAGVGHFPLWRRSLHQKVGLFDESFKAAGDAEWWARAYYLAKAKFYWLDEYLACYLWRNGENLWHKEISSDEWARFHTKVQEYHKC